MIKHLTINSYKSITHPSSIVIYFVSFLVYDLSAIFGMQIFFFFVNSIHFNSYGWKGLNLSMATNESIDFIGKRLIPNHSGISSLGHYKLYVVCREAVNNNYYLNKYIQINNDLTDSV